MRLGVPEFLFIWIWALILPENLHTVQTNLSLFFRSFTTQDLISQVRIAGTENTAQYWTNISVQIGPVLSQYWYGTLEIKISHACAEAWPSNGTLLGWKSALIRQTVLYVKKPVSGPAIALYWLQSRHYSGKPCCMSKRQCSAH